MLKLIFPKPNTVINTHTAIQDEFIEKIHKIGTNSALEWLLPVKDDRERSHPQEITLKWENDGSAVYTILLSEEKDVKTGIEYKTDKCEKTVTNLKINQKYYVFINDEFAGDFTTADNKYRFINIDGIMNVRDVGGIAIKQGLLYRGADISGEYTISKKGIEVFCNELKIKTELNLRMERHEDREFSVVGNGVRYKYLPYRPYAEIFKAENRNYIRDIFDFLADKNNYPIYFHCLGGADRTGMIALYLRALMGESDEDILTDFELTSLSTYALGLSEGVPARGFRNRNDEYFTEFLKLLAPYSDTPTLSAKVRAFLLDCGIEEETLDKVIEILS